jgi:peptidyl-dipeptidase Dcp
LTDTNESALIVDSVSELAGLSAGEIEAAADAAKARGLEGKYLLAMVNFSGNPMLESLEVRSTRERIMKASLLRGNRDNDSDTKKIIVEMAKLRATRAKLFGKKTHADSSSPSRLLEASRTFMQCCARSHQLLYVTLALRAQIFNR